MYVHSMIRLAYETAVAFWLRRRISLIWRSWHKWTYVAYHFIYNLLLIQLFSNEPWVMSLDSGCSSLCTIPLLVDSLLYMFNQKKDEAEISDIIKHKNVSQIFLCNRYFRIILIFNEHWNMFYIKFLKIYFNKRIAYHESCLFVIRISTIYT